MRNLLEMIYAYQLLTSKERHLDSARAAWASTGCSWASGPIRVGAATRG